MKISTTVVALVVLLSGGSASAASPFSSLIVFGDSLSDVGDNPSAVTSLYKELGGNCHHNLGRHMMGVASPMGPSPRSIWRKTSFPPE